jgi:molybdopterin synthase sulfur carrier subunit
LYIFRPVPHVETTPHLKRFFPALEPLDVDGGTVAEVIRAVDARHPGLASYVVDDRGALRKHVNVFIGEARVRDRERLSDPVPAGATVFILQALSGG